MTLSHPTKVIAIYDMFPDPAPVTIDKLVGRTSNRQTSNMPGYQINARSLRMHNEANRLAIDD